MPWRIWKKFITTHNEFHTGSSASWIEYAQEVIDLENAWKSHCDRKVMSAELSQVQVKSVVFPEN